VIAGDDEKPAASSSSKSEQEGALGGRRPAESKTLSLDAATTAQVDFVPNPPTAVGITPGEYQIVAVLEVPAETKLAADRWRGRAESGPIKPRVEERPARLTKANDENFNLSLARYYDATGDSRRALQYAEKASAVNPNPYLPSFSLGRSGSGWAT
jgi:hypothetical protein